MKKFLQIPLLLVAMLLTSIPISAHDFEVGGIYYNILNETAKTVEVTCKGDRYYSYSNEYTGSVTIPSSVTYNGTTYSVSKIGSSAFEDCSGLTSVTIPNSVTEIGSYAFCDCSGLTQVTIPNSVTSIGSYAFGWCSGLISATIPNSVTEIGEWAFGGCDGLTSITIPNSVTEIGDYAFCDCSGLTQVTIPNSVTSIGSSVFCDCTSLTTFNFNAENCSSMGSDSYPVFYKCKALKTINIGNDVKSIPNNAFIGCDSITTVNYNAENCSSMGSAYNSVFSGCKVLNTINIGNNVKTIPKYAFNNIASLITVNFNAENCSSMDTYYSSVFNGCKALNIINIGNNVTRIPNYAFCNCIGLTSISLPNSATSIGSYAFAYCDGLTSVTIPNSVTEIGSYAFNGTAWYNNQADGVIYINNVLYEYKGTMPDNTSINIKEGTVSISPYAFDGCAGLTSATIPNSVTEIGSSAFKGCSGLTNLILEDGEDAVSGLSFPDSPLESLYLGRNTNYPFAEGKTTLKTLMIGNMVSSICNSAFHGCTSLTSITIPNSVTTIGSDAFNGCSGLTSVTIPNSVTSIGSSAFMGCTKLAVPKLSNTTQTTATVGFTSSSNCPPYLLCNNKYYKNGDKITGLTPGLEYGREYSYSYGLEINGNYCKINTTDSKFKTSPIYLYLNGTANVTSIIANGTHSIGDATFVSEGLDLNASGSFDNRNEKIFYNLDPNTSYYVYYGMKVKERTSPYYVSESFTTGDLDLTTQEAKPTSTTSIRLLASTNCDATEGTGFEWRRYDAPAELPSSKVTCPVVDGVLVGSLRGVNKDVYYKYRPYYTSSSGKTYYGDWIAFFTGDANVYFEPEVRTYDDIQVIQNSAVVKGYALEGTDVITAQGFEYWKTGTAIKPSSTDDRMTINASGISMSATLANLEYNSTYKYRAFVTTAKGTVYGDEVEFSTGDDPAGIGYIEMDSDEFAVTLRENPVTGTAWVKIAGAAGEEVQYTITSMSGAMVATGSVMLDGEWNAIDLNCPSGMYLLTINDSTQIKTLRLIVK